MNTNTNKSYYSYLLCREICSAVIILSSVIICLVCSPCFVCYVSTSPVFELVVVEHKVLLLAATFISFPQFPFILCSVALQSSTMWTSLSFARALKSLSCKFRHASSYLEANSTYSSRSPTRRGINIYNSSSISCSIFSSLRLVLPFSFLTNAS